MKIVRFNFNFNHMNIRLLYLRDSNSGLARQYETSSGERFWIPRSVITKCLRFGNGVHDLTIEDWWWAKHENGEDEETDEAEESGE